MSRAETRALANQSRLTLGDPRDHEACTNGCLLFTTNRVPTGVALAYNSNDAVQVIRIEFLPPGESSPSWTKEVITKKLRGTTYQLVNHYSNELRLKLLGPEDSVDEKLLTLSQLQKSYKYLKLGLLLRVNFWGGRIPNAVQEFDSLDFVEPSAAAHHIFNDPDISGVSPGDKNHDNHLHVRLKFLP